MTLIGYVRVSTEDQAREGVSLAAQEDRVRAYCAAHGLELGDVLVEEGVSGTVPPMERPSLRLALESLAAGHASGLVVLRLDRLTRSIRDLLDLVDVCRKQRWALHSVTDRLDTDTPMGMFVLTILGAVGQLERDMISVRTKETLAHKRKQGAILGNAPYGWRKVVGADGKLTALEKDEKEQATVFSIRQMVKSGLTQGKIAARLNAAGIPSRTGKWSRRGIQCVLNQPEV